MLAKITQSLLVLEVPAAQQEDPLRYLQQFQPQVVVKVVQGHHLLKQKLVVLVVVRGRTITAIPESLARQGHLMKVLLEAKAEHLMEQETALALEAVAVLAV